MVRTTSKRAQTSRAAPIRATVPASAPAVTAQAPRPAASMAVMPQVDGSHRSTAENRAGNPGLSRSSSTAAHTSTQDWFSSTVIAALTRAASTAPSRGRTATPMTPIISRDSTTASASCNGTASTATATAAGPRAAAWTVSAEKAIRLTIGAMPANAAASRPAASRTGRRGSRAKCSGRRLSPPPPV